jgi:hypothetical protein
MSRAKKMKREKKIKYLFKASGFVIGGIIGSFLGYHMAQFSKAGAYDDVVSLSFWVCFNVIAR